MTDKVQLIKEEIERRINVCEKYSQLNLTESTRIGNHAQLLELCELKDFIDSLPEEPASEDLEEAASKYVREDFHERSRADFKAGAEWQKQQMIKNAENQNKLFKIQKKLMK